MTSKILIRWVGITVFSLIVASLGLYAQDPVLSVSLFVAFWLGVLSCKFVGVDVTK